MYLEYTFRSGEPNGGSGMFLALTALQPDDDIRHAALRPAVVNDEHGRECHRGDEKSATHGVLQARSEGANVLHSPLGEQRVHLVEQCSEEAANDPHHEVNT